MDLWALLYGSPLLYGLRIHGNSKKKIKYKNNQVNFLFTLPSDCPWAVGAKCDPPPYRQIGTAGLERRRDSYLINPGSSRTILSTQPSSPRAAESRLRS